jgi:hypothetical protein
MNKITRTKAMMLVALGALLLSGGSYFLVYKEVVKAHKEHVAIHAEYDTLIRERGHRDEVRALVADTVDVRAELAGYLVPDEPIDFLNLLEKELAQEAGVVLQVESLSKEDTGTGKLKKGEVPKDPHVQAVLLVEGQWENIYHFISLLETAPYALVVNRVNLSEEELETGYGWSGQIHMSVNTKN